MSSSPSSRISGLLPTLLSLLVLSGISLLMGPGLRAQTPAAPNQAQPGPAVRPDYVLGANDQILIRAPGINELNDQPFRINAEGALELPIIGTVKASGLSIRALEAELVNRLREFVREPQVFISLVQFRSEPVFFVGAFRNPGLYPLQGGHGLIEMLSTVGGLQPNAGHRIHVTRRSEYGPIPLPNAIVNSERKISTVDITLESLTQSVNPEEDIVLQPYDIVSAELSERVFVTGEVAKSAIIELGPRNSISITQALTEAGGFSATAARGSVRVLRPILGTNRRSEIVIDMKELLAGRKGDFPLLPNDVLYVTRSSGGRALATGMLPSMVTSLPYIIISALLR